MMTTPGPAPPALVRVGRVGGHLARMRDVLEWPGFDVELVAGAAGLDRPIRIAHATELVDPSAFLRGEELIMTVGSELVNPAACRLFVDNLVRRRAAGIALAIGVKGHEPPAALAPVADRAGLPLMTVPPHLPFVAFTERLQELADERLDHERQRHEDGRMLDYVRRGYASPQVFRDRFSPSPDARYVALCLPEHVSAEIGGVIVEGWIDEYTVVVAEEPYVRAFEESTSLPVFGTGGAVSFGALARTLKECVAACALSARRGRSAGPRDLATLSGLVERLTADQLAPFHDHVVAPLRRYDARHGRSLVPTLMAYVESGASVTATAERLAVHANSVRNRMAKIAELTGLDPHDLRDQVTFAIAVHGAAVRATVRPDGATSRRPAPPAG